MKPTRINKITHAPTHWAEIPWGESYRSALEDQLKLLLAKMRIFNLLKIGNLSAEINTDRYCTISQYVSDINAFYTTENIQNKNNKFYLPFADKSIDACLLAQTLSWCQDPNRLLREVDRVLIDDGWIILSGFNPLSIIGLHKLVPLFRYRKPYNSRMFTMTKQIDWLSLLNFEVLYCTSFQVLPWLKQGNKLLNKHFPALGCIQIIAARKRTVPLILNPIKQSRTKMQLYPVSSTT